MAHNLESDIKLIEDEIKEVKKLLLVENRKPSILKNYQGLLYVAITIIGIGINWGISTNKISQLESNVQTLEVSLAERVKEIQDLRVKQATSDTTTQMIAVDIKDIKDSIKSLLERDRNHVKQQ